MNPNPKNSHFFKPVQYRLRSQDQYHLGESIILGLTLENLTKKDLWFLNWYTPFEGIKGKIFQVTSNGTEIRYEGRMIKRGDPTSMDYVHICPNSSISVNVDLSSVYNLHVLHSYKVKFRGRIYDIVYNLQSIPRKIDEHCGFDMTGNVVTFSIIN